MATRLQFDPEKFLRGRYRVGFSTIIAEWSQGNDEYLALASWPEGATEYRVDVAHFNTIRSIWEQVTLPAGVDYLAHQLAVTALVPAVWEST